MSEHRLIRAAREALDHATGRKKLRETTPYVPPHKDACHYCNYSVLRPCTDEEHANNCDNY